MDADQSKLFIGGISWETTEEMLKHHFNKYGTVLGSIIGKDRDTQKPRGFGFVWFSDSSAADKALEDTHVILGRTVDVKRAIPRSEQQQQQQHHHPNQQQQNNGLSKNSSDGDSNSRFRTKKIFVGGLSADLTEQEFKNFFERFGRITDVVVMHDINTQRPRGFGFVTFDSEESVENVMQKTFYELNSKFVEVKKAVPKEGTNGNTSGFNSRVGAGRVSLYNSSHAGEYHPYSPGYGVFPGYTNLLGYSGVGGYPYGTGVYGSGYPMVGGYGRIGSGVTPVDPRSFWYGTVMIGPRVLPPAYGNAPFYHSYMNGGLGFMGTVAGGYNGGVEPGVDGKLNQDLGGNRRLPANATPPQTVPVTLDVDSSGLRVSNGGNSSEQNQRGLDGQFKPFPVGISR